MIYVVFGLIVALGAIVLIRPLLGSGGVTRAGDPEQAVYRAQLSEVVAERDAGLITPADADGAILEIERRLLRTAARDDQPNARSLGRGEARILVLALALGVPVATAFLYDDMGRPNLPDAPLAARLTPAGSVAEVTTLIDRLAQQMKSHPDDPRGWNLLAEARAKQGRYLDAARAYGQVARLMPQDLGSRLEAAQLYIVAGQGHVGPEAARLIAETVKLAPQAPGVRHFRAYQKLDRGDAAGAEADWRALAESLPANAPLRADALTGIARARKVEGLPALDPETVTAASGPRASDVAAAATMPAADRKAMIADMVARLAKKLKANPTDADGWQRLARAYEVMGRQADAADAWAKAAALRPGDPTLPAKAAEARAAAGKGK